MSTHTPGPWTAILDRDRDDGSEDTWYVLTDNEAAIAVGLYGPDAHLIAAAPELLAALKAMTDYNLFLKEHREAKGMSAEDMGRKLGIERESVYRLEREAFTRLNPEKQVAYAKALNIAPQDLWQPPFLDGMAENARAAIAKAEGAS